MPKLIKKSVESPLIQAMQSIFGSGPEEAMGLGGGNLPLASTIRMAMKSAPGFTREAWKGRGGIQKFLADLPEVFDYIFPEGIQLKPAKAFMKGKRGLSDPVARGTFNPPVSPGGKYRPQEPSIHIRAEGKATPLEEGITSETQSVTVPHEFVHTAQGIREATLRYTKEAGRKPPTDPKELWEAIKPYFPTEAGSFPESHANILGSRLAKTVPIGYGVEKNLRHLEPLSRQPEHGVLAETLMDLHKILALGSLY